MLNYLRTVPLVLSALILVRAHALRANELANSFQDSVVFTNVGYASGSNVASNFPLRVDISTVRPHGFEYDLAGVKAADLRFNYYEEYLDNSTNAVIDTTVNYAVTNWNSEGVSTLYVCLPRFSASTKAKLTMYWNPVDYAELPENNPLLVPYPVTNAERSVVWNQAVVDQSTNENYIACGYAYRRVKEHGAWVTKRINYWLTEPTISKKQWKQGEAGATITLGVPCSPDPVTTVEYFDRNTSGSLGTVQPLTPGAYRATVTVASSDTFAELKKSLDFDIISAVVVGGQATTNDFSYRAVFSLNADAIKDASLAASFNYLKTKAGATKAVSGYSYKTEINASGEVTIGCWFRVDPTTIRNHPSTDQADKIQIISLSGGQNTRGPVALAMQNNSTSSTATLKLRTYGVGYKSGTTTPTWQLLVDKECNALGDGGWHFAMVTRCKATGVTCLYFDGELLGSSTNAGWPFYDDGSINNLSIGCDPVSPDHQGMSFVGEIAEAQVYDMVLDADAVKGLYTSKRRLTGSEEGLLAYYPLNDKTEPWAGTGAELADKNRNGYVHNIAAAGSLSWVESELPFKGGTDILNGKPFLVKIADGSPKGFYYENLVFGQTKEAFYSDVRFFDESGEPVDYQIDTWNPGGDSYIWVKVRKFSENTRVIMCWGQSAYTELPENNPSSVWDPKTTEEEKEELRRYYLSNYDTMVKTGTVHEEPEMRLQNRWIVPPSMSFTQWAPGESAPVVVPGTTYGGSAKVSYWDRSTGKALSSLPSTQVGEYRAIFRFTETEKWSSLEAMINFRVVKPSDSHDLGDVSRRILLANDDGSVSGGEVAAQSYDDNEDGWGLPYWTHHEFGSDEDVSDFDATKLFAAFNLFPGTCHEYMFEGKRLWGLERVRFGNLFNNGRHYPGEEGDAGLRPGQNYLPWNPQSSRMLAYQGMTVGDYHRYAGTFVMQNVCDEGLKRYAQICSPCYDEGIGTIYFDVVNAFTNNVRDVDGNANYAIVVEVATNIVGYTERPPVDELYPHGIRSAYDFYFYADWHAVEMTPVRFRDNTGSDTVDCEQLPTTTELELDITHGGTRKNFYRVYVPVNLDCKARFRIRRTRIDRNASLNPDADAFIIVDNVICSPARDIVTLVPYGFQNNDRRGKQWLGHEFAFDPPFPGVGDAIYGRVRAVDRNGADVPAGSVTAVSMHYRWKYLNQAKTDWSISDFYPSTLRSISPLVLPAGLPGDVEFWFEGSQNTGYYNYANYSGTRIGVPWYSESYSLITNGWSGTSAQWSVRLREARSDLEESVLVVREPSGAVKEFQMALVGDHQWRGYYMTTNPIPEGVDVRIEFRNLETPGDTVWSWNTNRYCLALSKPMEVPYSGRMNLCGTNDWMRVPVDAYTGYLMFQADDSSRGLSIVRADYQNFNHWTDGHGDVFVGSAADDSALPGSGVSPLVRDFYAYYTTNQTVQVSTNALWNLDFGSARTYTYYKTFAAGEETVNGWPLGKGRFVYGRYRDPDTGTALQMAGCGEGYAEFSDQAIGLWPRGVEKVTFGARLAQSVGFDDFSYYDGDSARKNYCFVADGAFDRADSQTFTGNASFSLVGYYRRGKGCYELRWEQVKGKVDTTGIAHEFEPRGQVLSLYRWNRNGSGGYDQTLLCSFSNSSTFQFNMPTVGASTTLTTGNFMPMSLAVYEYTDTDGKTGTMIVAGVHAGGSTKLSDKSWRYAAYLDADDKRLVSGSYGVLTANSPGYLVRPRIGDITDPQALNWQGLTRPKAGKSANSGKDGRVYPSAITLESCRQDIEDEMWVTVPGRNESFIQEGVCGFKAADVGQTVSVVASKTVGALKFDTVLKTHSLSNYWGKIKVSEEFGADIPLIWRTEDAFLRLRTGGDLDGIRTDVIIDDIKVHQWRGRNEIYLYEKDGKENSPDNPNDSRTPVSAGDPDNFVYTSGWVNRHGDTTALEVSAKRTIPGRPAGVRTPLMDGYAGRGSGIGNLEFHYRDCQTNTVLLVQVATNVYRGNLVALTKDVTEDDGNETWSTVARLTYDQLGEAGSTNISFGVRKGAGDNGCIARVIVDPALVDALADVDDPTAFGAIEFLKVMCQDEPPINKGCWWGWNIRTLGNAGDTEKRMYLPDDKEEPVGYSMALNNSTTDDVVSGKAKEYRRHMPFLQSPSFTNENVIGEVSFRARKYAGSTYSQYAEVAVYGITLDKMARAEDADWELLTRFVISNTVYTTYSYRAIDDGKYSAIRLGVTGVSGVQTTSRGPKPLCGDTPVRVLLDEVTISEAVSPELAIRNLGAFRYDMQSSAAAENVPSRSQQPLCREGWGVQCELYAVMLEEQISTRHPPRVKLYWYQGSDVWGFKNWKDLPDAHSGWLARATDTDALIYRSSYDTAPDAVIPQSVKEGLDSPVVQYMVEIFYTTVDPKSGAGTQHSRFVEVESGEWTVPEWYAPVDYNTDPDYGRGEDYSCFCILDDIAPGWAWINEVNILGGLDRYGYNVDRNCQFVEIAAPVTADLSGWKIQMIQSCQSSGYTVTNTVATFGMRGLSGTKSLLSTSNYVFHVVANPDLRDPTLDRSIFNEAGTLDATWKFEDFDNGYLFNTDYTLCDTEPVGVRLLRPNGIVEHEILTIGEDMWGGSYSPSNVVKYLNRVMKPGKFFFPADDINAGDHSVGVVNGMGEGNNGCWNNTMMRTPGRINEDQQINPDIPVPYGEMIYIYSDLDQSGGNIWQSGDGGNTFTNATLRFFIKRDSILGTNIVFKVEPWYEVAYCRQTCAGETTYFDVTNGFNRTTREVTVRIAKGCSNTVNVVTKATVDRQLAEYGVDENNPYTPAIIRWLQDGSTLRGEFLNNDGIIRLGEFWGRKSGYISDLTLTEMYWLDMDPTAGDMVLRGGWSEAPHQVLIPAAEGRAALTNDKMSVFMMITNKTEDVTSPLYAQAWTPYVLRSVEPTKTSWDYEPGSTSDWASVTFKIKGIILNEHTSVDNPDNWADLRWFVFHKDSFHQPGNELGAEPYTADVEILDPVHRHDSPGYDAGWVDWVNDPEHPERADKRPYYRWRIDTRLKPKEIEVLKTNNVTVVTQP